MRSLETDVHTSTSDDRHPTAPIAPAILASTARTELEWCQPETSDRSELVSKEICGGQLGSDAQVHAQSCIGRQGAIGMTLAVP